MLPSRRTAGPPQKVLVAKAKANASSETLPRGLNGMKNAVALQGTHAVVLCADGVNWEEFVESKIPKRETLQTTLPTEPGDFSQATDAFAAAKEENPRETPGNAVVGPSTPFCKRLLIRRLGF